MSELLALACRMVQDLQIIPRGLATLHQLYIYTYKEEQYLEARVSVPSCCVVDYLEGLAATSVDYVVSKESAQDFNRTYWLVALSLRYKVDVLLYEHNCCCTLHDVLSDLSFIPLKPLWWLIWGYQDDYKCT